MIISRYKNSALKLYRRISNNRTPNRRILWHLVAHEPAQIISWMVVHHQLMTLISWYQSSKPKTAIKSSTHQPLIWMVFHLLASLRRPKCVKQKSLSKDANLRTWPQDLLLHKPSWMSSLEAESPHHILASTRRSCAGSSTRAEIVRSALSATMLMERTNWKREITVITNLRQGHPHNCSLRPILWVRILLQKELILLSVRIQNKISLTKKKISTWQMWPQNYFHQKVVTWTKKKIGDNKKLAVIKRRAKNMFRAMLS